MAKITIVETLTRENIRDGMYIQAKDHPNWGCKRVGHDRNGWYHGTGSDSAMLFENEFKFWDVVKIEYNKRGR